MDVSLRRRLLLLLPSVVLGPRLWSMAVLLALLLLLLCESRECSTVRQHI